MVVTVEGHMVTAWRKVSLSEVTNRKLDLGLCEE